MFVQGSQCLHFLVQRQETHKHTVLTIGGPGSKTRNTHTHRLFSTLSPKLFKHVIRNMDPGNLGCQEILESALSELKRCGFVVLEELVCPEKLQAGEGGGESPGLSVVAGRKGLSLGF